MARSTFPIGFVAPDGANTDPVRPSERGFFAIFSPLNSLADIDRHPFFVFGERSVRLLEIAEFTYFVRREQRAREQRLEFGCFRPVLRCREHLIGPFCSMRLSAVKSMWG